MADANHVLFFNGQQGYQVSHPLDGGDACLSMNLSKALLAELMPKSLTQSEAEPTFRTQSLRIDARAQALVALLRHSLDNGSIEPLEAEALALTPYSIEQILRMLIERCDTLKLYVRGSRRDAVHHARWMIERVAQAYSQGETPLLLL